MRAKNEFAIREIGGDYVLIPMGKMALTFSGFITTNEVGVFIWECLQDEITEEEVLNKVLDTFEIEKDVALKDIQEFLEKAKSLGMIE